MDATAARPAMVRSPTGPAWLAATALTLAALGCGPTDGPKVVVYSSAAPGFSGPILEDHGRKSGVEVVTRFEAKGVDAAGLARIIVQESPRPRCDLFWSGSLFEILRLRQKGMLASWSPPNAPEIPARFRAKDGTWYGFAAKARVLLVHTGLVAEGDRPKGLDDLVAPRWKGRAALARPSSGSTATHFTCLFAAWGDEKTRAFVGALKANGVGVLRDNREVAAAVGSGRFAFGLTDSDDAVGEVGAGHPVAIVYPDREPGQLGTLFLPDALAIPKGAPDPGAAEAMGNALLGPETEARLARGPSGRSPLNRTTKAPAGVESPRTVHAMEVDFEAAATLWDRVAAFLAAEFAGP